MHEHSPGSGSGTRLLHYSSTMRVAIWSTLYCFMDAGCVRLLNMCAISEYTYADYAFQDLLQAGETNVSAGRATMFVSVLLGTHRMHH